MPLIIIIIIIMTDEVLSTESTYYSQIKQHMIKINFTTIQNDYAITI